MIIEFLGKDIVAVVDRGPMSGDKEEFSESSDLTYSDTEGFMFSITGSEFC